MEEFLHTVMSNNSAPIVTAFVLGLMTAISPCPLATNITAIGFISKDLDKQRKVFISGVLYTVGRALSYTILALIIFFGADQFKVSDWFLRYGEKILGPLLIVIGVFMLGIIRLRLPGSGKLAQRIQKKERHSYWDALLIGIVFALAFCPLSGVYYFLFLIPITVSSASGLYLPVVFAIGTGLPVIIFAWLLAYTVSGVGKFYNNLKTFELWFRRVISVIFIGVGIYYVVIIYL
jgi:cytochrome c biogenesis protein CcdA